MPPSHPLIERLASEHDVHLRWLRQRLSGRLEHDEIEDVLQAAYTKALAALNDTGGSAPTFESDDKARAWLRTIATNVATDLHRQRHGRRPGTTARKVMRLQSLDGPVAVADVLVDVEDDVIGAVERESYAPLVARAFESLKPQHRQLLKLRYGDGLEPSSIMLLERLNRRQWDGRHTRALNALVKALGRLQMSGACGETRRLLRSDPVTLLRARQGGAASHVEDCPACRAFSLSAQSALAALPLPFAIEAWKFDVLDYFGVGRGDAPAAPDSVSASCSAASRGLPFRTAWLAGVVVAAGAVAANAGFGEARTDSPQRRVVEQREVVAVPRERAAWADHSTSRRSLERSARRMAQTRAERHGTSSRER